jgi:hypothetical protein
LKVLSPNGVGGIILGLPSTQVAMSTVARNVIGLIGAVAGSAVQNRGKVEWRTVAINAVGNSLGAAVFENYKQNQIDQGRETLAAMQGEQRPAQQYQLSADGFRLPSIGGADSWRIAPIAGSADNQPSNHRLLNDAEQQSNPSYYTSVGGRSVTAQRGDTYSTLAGSSRPIAVGGVAAANNAQSDLVEIGKSYFIPDDPMAYGDQSRLGQALLNVGNERREAIAHAIAIAQLKKAEAMAGRSIEQLGAERAQMEAGAWRGRNAQAPTQTDQVSRYNFDRRPTLGFWAGYDTGFALSGPSVMDRLGSGYSVGQAAGAFGRGTVNLINGIANSFTGYGAFSEAVDLFKGGRYVDGALATTRGTLELVLSAGYSVVKGSSTAATTALRRSEFAAGINNEMRISASTPNIAAIEGGYVSLSGRQSRLLLDLDTPGATILVPKSMLSTRDLGALTARTGDEFAMFTLRGERLVVRGDSSGILYTQKELSQLSEAGFRFSGHSHPRVNGAGDILSVNSSSGDRGVLGIFNQSRSVIIDSGGNRNVFSVNSDSLIYPKK